MKNLALLSGRPLLDYGVRAVQAANTRIDRIICSTDSDAIADRAVELGVEVDRRPAHLAGDDTPVADVGKELLERLGTSDSVPDILILVQPTSPFLLPVHVDSLAQAMIEDVHCRSGQTVTPVPHNFHAWNQRDFDAGRTRFHFAKERAAAYNKQRKPKLFTFANLVGARSAALLDGQDFFAEPSAALEVPWPYNLDVDTPQDLILAEALIASHAVDSPLRAAGA